MFYVIKEDKLYEYGDNVTQAWNFPDEAKELSGVEMFYFENHKEQFVVQNGILVDISGTEEYLSGLEVKDKTLRIEKIKAELEVLDIKCIRAIREGANDDEGIPFLEKYQSEINNLRDELNTLE